MSMHFVFIETINNCYDYLISYSFCFLETTNWSSHKCTLFIRFLRFLLAMSVSMCVERQLVTGKMSMQKARQMCGGITSIGTLFCYIKCPWIIYSQVISSPAGATEQVPVRRILASSAYVLSLIFYQTASCRFFGQSLHPCWLTVIQMHLG